MTQAVAKQGHERLRARVNPQTLRAKCDVRRHVQKRARRELAQQGLSDTQREAGVATADGVANFVRFGAIEKEQLIRFGHCLIAGKMAHVDAAVGKDEVRGCGTFFSAL